MHLVYTGLAIVWFMTSLAIAVHTHGRVCVAAFISAGLAYSVVAVIA